MAGDIDVSRLPGFDGGTLVPRFQNRVHPDLKYETDPVYYTVIEAVMGAVRTKALNGWKEAHYTPHIQGIKRVMQSQHSSDILKQAALLLPMLYKEALTMLTTYGACEWHTQVHYVMCNRCEHLYRCEARDRTTCSQCETPKDKENTSKYIHMCASGHISYLWGHIVTAKLMTHAADRKSKNPNMIFDINDVNDPYKFDPTLPTTDFNSPVPDPHNMSVMMSQDPFQPFGNNHPFSVSPATLIFNNLPPDMRQKKGFVHLLGIGPGTRNIYDKALPMPAGVVKSDRSKWLVLVDEAIYLDKVGIMVKDAYATSLHPLGTDQFFRCRMRITNVISDFRGMEEVLGIHGTPSYHGCLICWWHGCRVGGKTLYCDHRRLLASGDKLRSILQNMWIPLPPDKETPPQAAIRTARGLDDLPVHLRSNKELAMCAAGPQREEGLQLVVGEPTVVQHCESASLVCISLDPKGRILLYRYDIT